VAEAAKLDTIEACQVDCEFYLTHGVPVVSATPNGYEYNEFVYVIIYVYI
jgi:hypothetical protein